MYDAYGALTAHTKKISDSGGVFKDMVVIKGIASPMNQSKNIKCPTYIVSSGRVVGMGVVAPQLELNLLYNNLPCWL